MEDMNLVIHPTQQTVAVNPRNPNIPLSLAKQVCLKFQRHVALMPSITKAD